MVGRLLICGSQFTLIELLLVVAIIGILAAMLLPVLGRARNSARKVYCLNNLKQCGLGLFAYESDYREFPAHEIDLEGTGQTWERAVSDGGPAGDAFEFFDEYFDIFQLRCPFVDMPLRQSLLAARPLADIRVMSTYSYFPGYAHDWSGDAGSGVTWGEPWRSTRDTWQRLGPKAADVNVLMGDLMCEIRGGNVSCLNHPGDPAGRLVNLRPDVRLYSWYYAASYYEVPVNGLISMPSASGNFLRRDGSVQNYRGSDLAMAVVPVYIYSVRGQAGHWLPID